MENPTARNREGSFEINAPRCSAIFGMSPVCRAGVRTGFFDSFEPLECQKGRTAATDAPVALVLGGFRAHHNGTASFDLVLGFVSLKLAPILKSVSWVSPSFSFPAAPFPGHGFGLVPESGSFAASAFPVPPRRHPNPRKDGVSARDAYVSVILRRQRTSTDRGNCQTK